MKELYTTPEFEILYASADIITTSPLDVEEDNEFGFGDIDA